MQFLYEDPCTKWSWNQTWFHFPYTSWPNFSIILSTWRFCVNQARIVSWMYVLLSDCGLNWWLEARNNKKGLSWKLGCISWNWKLWKYPKFNRWVPLTRTHLWVAYVYASWENYCIRFNFCLCRKQLSELCWYVSYISIICC